MNKIVVDRDTMHWYGEPPCIPCGQQLFSQFEFSLSEDWDNANILAQFKQGDTLLNVAVTENTCYVPYELNPGTAYLRLRGTFERNSEVIATVNELQFNLVQGFEPGGSPSVPPTPDLYQKLIQSIQHIEFRVGELAEQAQSSAEVAKADANRVATLAEEVSAKAAQAAQDATESVQAKEAAQTAQHLAETAQQSAEEAKDAAEAAQAAVSKSATDAEAAKQGAEAALSDAQAAASAAAQALVDIRALYQEMQTWAQGVIRDANAAADSASQSATSAAGSASAASEAQSAAETAQRGAEEAKTKAEASKEASAKSEAAAKLSEQNAKASEDAAKASETASAGSASAAADSATAAQAAQNGAEASRSAAEQSAQQAAESAAVYDTVVADVNQIKQDITAITPDDTTVDGKPWTSKHIVDSLCQPIEENGNPVQCYPVENYPLGVKVQIEPKQEGSGDPSPDNIRPITGRDAVKVTRCGKNLLDLGDAYVKGYNITGIPNFLTPNTTYSFTVRKSGGIAFAVYIANNTNTSNADKQLRLTTGYVKEGATQTFTTPADMKEYPYFVLAGNSSGIGDIYPDVEFQIELGTTAPTIYEPYTGSTTDIALPETVYGGEVDAESGVVTVDRFMHALTGNETWKFRDLSVYPNTFMYGYGKRIVKGICTHYKSLSLAELNREDDGVYLSYTVSIIVTDHRFDTIEAFKAYLSEQYAAGTPVQIVYEIQEPYTIQLSPQQIAALSGVNTLYTDADGVVVTGAEDPKHTITELKNAIISLGGNV